MTAESAAAEPLTFALHPQQGATFTTRANEILYGGAAGGGKSHLMRVAAITWCLQVPGLQVYLFRRQYPDLKANHMEGPSSFYVMLAELVNAGKCRILESKGRILFSNGSTIHLCHLQQKKHLVNYQGAEIHVLLIDELTHFQKEMFTFLRSRCRVAGLKIPHHFPPGYFPRILCGCNPGGVGHVWVKEAFVDGGAYRLRKRPKWDGGMIRTYIPAQLSDNPSLQETDPDYENRLKGLGDPALVRAMLEGDWDIVAGAMFGEKWRAFLHVCAPFPIPATWPIWRGADDGFAAPAACYWLTEDPDKKTIFVVSEIYRAGMLPREYAEAVKETDASLIVATPEGETVCRGTIAGLPPIDGLMDAAAFANTGQAEIPRGLQIVRAGAKFRPVEKWPGSRVHRVQEFHRRLAANPNDPKGRPGIIFFNTCKSAIKTIPALPRDDRNPEDVDTDGEDHCFVVGTMIRTPNGQRQIEEIQRGDLVCTRLGAFPVAANWVTRNAGVVENHGLTGTPHHPIWTPEGYKRLDLLTPCDTVCTWHKWTQSSFRGQRFGDTLIHPGEKIGFILSLAEMIEREASKHCIERFTRRISGQFRKECISIIETETLSTILQKTLNACRARITPRNTWKRNYPFSERTSEKLKRRLLCGIAAKLAGNGILTTQNGQQQPWQKRLLSAANVERNTRENRLAALSIARELAPPAPAENPGRTTLKRNARFADTCSKRTDTGARRRVLGVAEQSYSIADVWNLTVDGPGEFFANDILVLNSFDAVTYGLQWKSRKLVRKRVKGV